MIFQKKKEEVKKVEEAPYKEFPVKVMMYFSEWGFADKEKEIDMKLNLRIEKLEKDDRIENITIEYGKFKYDDKLQLNIDKPEDAEEEELYFRKDYYIHCNFKNVVDYLASILAHSPNYAELMNMNKITEDAHIWNASVGLILDTNLKLTRENQTMKGIIMKECPHYLIGADGKPLPKKKVVKKKVAKKKPVRAKTTSRRITR